MNEEAVAKQPETREKCRAALTVGLALTSLCCDGVCLCHSEIRVPKVVVGRLDQEWLSELETSESCSWHALPGCCPRFCAVKRVKLSQSKTVLPIPSASLPTYLGLFYSSLL